MSSEKNNKKLGLPKIPDGDLEAINNKQLYHFFKSYDYDWRFTKLIINKHILENRENMPEVLEYFYQHFDNFNCESYIYREMTNGLIISSVAETMMYIEDFFCFIKNIRNPKFFVKDTISYKAGKVTKIGEKLKTLNNDTIKKCFMLPAQEHFEKIVDYFIKEAEYGKTNKIKLGTDNLTTYCNDICDFFERFDTLYNQYKHGLKICLSEFQGRHLLQEESVKRKARLSTNPYYYDNYNHKHSLSIILSDLPPEHLKTLEGEGNLLQFNPNGEINFEDVFSVAKKTMLLIKTLIWNRIELINFDHSQGYKVYLPNECDQIGSLFCVVFPDLSLTVHDFQVDL